MCLGIPGQIVEIVDETYQIAKADVSGVKRSVSIALLAEESIKPGDWVLIHVGFAMSKLSQEQADDQLKMLAMLGESEAALQEAEGYGLSESEPQPSRSGGP